MFGTGSVLLLAWWCFAIRKLSLWSPEGEKGFDTFRRVYFWKRIIIWVRMVDASPPWPQPFRNTHPPQLLYPLVFLSAGQQLLAYFEEVIARFNLTCFIPPWHITLTWLDEIYCVRFTITLIVILLCDYTRMNTFSLYSLKKVELGSCPEPPKSLWVMFNIGPYE